VTAAAGEDPLRVRGGAGGTTARLDDLEIVAEQLCGLGRDLAGVAARLVAVDADPMLLASIARRPVTGIAAESAVLSALGGRHGVAACAGEAAVLGATLRTAVAAYRGADAVAAAALRGLATGVGDATPSIVAAAVLALPIPALAGVVPVVATGGQVLLDLLGRHPGSGDVVGAGLPGVVSGLLGPVGRSLLGGPAAAAADPEHQRHAAGVLGRVGGVSPYLRENGRVRTVVDRPRPVRAPSGVASLLARTAELYPDHGGTPGSIRVEGVLAADGSRSWIVMIPGTQTWAPRPGANPFDAAADVATVGGRPTAAGSLVLQGLRSCGARPGEPVLLVGHSLGGMVATELAADPAVRRELTITTVVTAGSPSGGSPVPDDVTVLSMEHDTDVVPWTDGRQNPDSPNWVTVHAPAGAPDPVGAHLIDRYVETGRAVDASEEATVVGARGELAPFLDGDGVTAIAWVITGERLPEAGG
jgi:pimeloyl-ACP methyl ester carboxylesterase